MWFLSFILLIFSACGFMGKQADFERLQDQSDSFGGYDDRDSYPGDEKRSSKLELQQQEQENQQVTNATEPEQEKKIYFGSCRLQVADPAETSSQVARIADESGGYVEAMYEKYIIIRVPRNLFDQLFSQILQLGEVMAKSVETYDVSEYFQDLTTRLKVAEKARERLYALLDRTTDVEERLKILKEIRRITEEIEKINLNLESIRKLIAFSRITVELEPRLENVLADDKSRIPFSWIAGLDPFYTSLGTLEGKIRFEPGDDFAVFDKAGYFHAESPEGIKIRIANTKNKPRGDTAFWQAALAYHLQKYYQSTELLQAGPVQAVLFTSKDKKPFFYLVGVLVADDFLYVVEVLFPDEVSFRENNAGVQVSLNGLEVK